MNAQLSFEQCEKLRILTLEDEASKVPALEEELAHVKSRLTESLQMYSSMVANLCSVVDRLNNTGSQEVCS